MSISVGRTGDDDDVVAEINTTPLVDVMLVLLIIFLITVPVVMQPFSVDLPRESVKPSLGKPETIVVSVAGNGDMFWNNLALSGATDLATRLLQASAGATLPPEVHIYGDVNVRYESIAKVVDACQRAGIAKVAFITDPAGR